MVNQSLLNNESLQDSADRFIMTLAKFGLGISGKTGGSLYCNVSEATIEKSFFGKSKLILSDNEPISFQSADIFMTSLARTEDLLKLRLFN